MKKINVVKSNQDFNDIINNSKFVKNKYFVIYYRPNDLNRYRFGISVSKHTCNAVNRNKLKRQVRNILDNCKNIYSNCKDYIIIIRKSSFMEDYHILEENLISLLSRLEKENRNEEK